MFTSIIESDVVICIYAHFHACLYTCVYVYVYWQFRSARLLLHVCLYPRLHSGQLSHNCRFPWYACISIHFCIRGYIYVFFYVCVYIYDYVCVHLRGHVCVNVSVHLQNQRLHLRLRHSQCPPLIYDNSFHVNCPKVYLCIYVHYHFDHWNKYIILSRSKVKKYVITCVCQSSWMRHQISHLQKIF